MQTCREENEALLIKYIRTFKQHIKITDLASIILYWNKKLSKKKYTISNYTNI